MAQQMYLHYFTQDTDFPFFIQFGHHHEEMFVHAHEDFSELVIILEGTATHIVNGEDYPVKKGEVFVINDNTSHGYKNPHQFHICNIMFRPSCFLSGQHDIKSLPGYHALFVIEPVLTQQRGFQGRLSLSTKDFEGINRMIIEIYHEYTTHSAGYQTIITGLFLQLAAKLSRLHNIRENHPENISVCLAEAVAHMEKHFQEEMSIEKLASTAGMSSRHFRRTFQNIYGTSPIKYINTLRLETAKRLLAATEMPITEIALQCGFCDSNYFSSKFKQAMGISPTSFRRQSWPGKTTTPYNEPAKT